MALNTGSFRRDLERTINAHSRESGSNTPDFILADLLCTVLNAWDAACGERERWYGCAHAPGRGVQRETDTARMDNPSSPDDAPHWRKLCQETSLSLAQIHEEALQLKAENARLVERDHKRVQDMSSIAEQRNQAQAAERATEAEAAAMREEVKRLRVECDRWRRDCLSAKDAAEHAQDQLRSHP